MTNSHNTVVVTGSQGIGAGVVNAFLKRGYNVVANALSITNSGVFEPSATLTLVDGDIAQSTTAGKVADVAISQLGSIDAFTNNAGIFRAKSFTEYTIDDLRSLISVNIEG